MPDDIAASYVAHLASLHFAGTGHAGLAREANLGVGRILEHERLRNRGSTERVSAAGADAHAALQAARATAIEWLDRMPRQTDSLACRIA